jgi:hypothetical protein
MPTAELTILLYLFGTRYLRWCTSLKQLQGPGGTGARANGHEGDHHDGLRSLYHFRTLFHGTSAHPKETGSEVAGVKSYSKKIRRVAPAHRFASGVILFPTVSSF